MLTKPSPEVKLGIAAAKCTTRCSDSETNWDSAVRAEAMSSAIYYAECSLNKISRDGAFHADEIARSRQNWWLPGIDPSHPSLRSPTSVPRESVSSDAQQDSTVSVAIAAVPASPRQTRNASTNLLEDEHQGSDIVDAPLFAQDDDLGSIPSLRLLNKSPKTYVQPAAVSPDSPGRKKSPVAFHKSVFGNAEDTILSHHIYSRIHGPKRPQCKRTSPPSENENVASVFIKPSLPGQNEIILESEVMIKAAKSKLLSSLKDSSDKYDPCFFEAVATLEHLYQSKMTSKSMMTSAAKKMKSSHENDQHVCMDGTWLMISPPTYPACVGVNDIGERMFTLGRMTFDMFQPSNLVCSIQKQYNTIRTVTSDEKLPTYIPPSLRREAENERKKHCGKLKAHNIIASFTIEQGTHNDDDTAQGKQKKLKGLLTTYGYTLPDPLNPNRKSIWFTAGTIEPADGASLESWKELFGEKHSSDSARTQYTEKARSLASEILLGAVQEPMDEHGTASFYLTHPIGGHGYAYCDVVFMDRDIRIMRGHSGSVLVFRRVFL